MHARALILLATTLTAACVAPAAAQSIFFERDKAYNQCQRDAARRFGPPPRTEPRPGDDLVQLERNRRDYNDRFGRFLGQCYDDADRRLRDKKDSR